MKRRTALAVPLTLLTLGCGQKYTGAHGETYVCRQHHVEITRDAGDVLIDVYERKIDGSKGTLQWRLFDRGNDGLDFVNGQPICAMPNGLRNESENLYELVIRQSERIRDREERREERRSQFLDR